MREGVRVMEVWGIKYTGTVMKSTVRATQIDIFRTSTDVLTLAMNMMLQAYFHLV